MEIKEIIELARSKTVFDCSYIAEFNFIINAKDGRSLHQKIYISQPILIEELFICFIYGNGPINVESPSVSDISLQSLCLAIAGLEHKISRYAAINDCKFSLIGSKTTENDSFVEWSVIRKTIFAYDFTA